MANASSSQPSMDPTHPRLPAVSTSVQPLPCLVQPKDKNKHEHAFLTKLAELHANKTLCDVTVVLDGPMVATSPPGTPHPATGEVKLRVHRLVLACISPVLESMLKGSFSESTQEEVRLHGVSESALELLIGLCLRTEAGAAAGAHDVHSVLDLLFTAHYLGASDVVAACLRWFQVAVKQSTCVCMTDQMLAFEALAQQGERALEAGLLEQVQEVGLRHVAAHFSKLCRGEAMLHISEGLLVRVLQRDDLALDVDGDEQEVLDLVMRWLEARNTDDGDGDGDIEETRARASEAASRLLPLVRLAHIRQLEVLSERLPGHPLLGALPMTRDLIHRALLEKCAFHTRHIPSHSSAAPLIPTRKRKRSERRKLVLRRRLQTPGIAPRLITHDPAGPVVVAGCPTPFKGDQSIWEQDRATLVHVYDPRTGECLHRMETQHPHNTTDIVAIAVDHEGTFFVATRGGWDGVDHVVAYNKRGSLLQATLEQACVFESEEGSENKWSVEIRGLAFDNNGHVLVLEKHSNEGRRLVYRFAVKRYTKEGQLVESTIQHVDHGERTRTVGFPVDFAVTHAGTVMIVDVLRDAPYSFPQSTEKPFRIEECEHWGSYADTCHGNIKVDRDDNLVFIEKDPEGGAHGCYSDNIRVVEHNDGDIDKTTIGYYRTEPPEGVWHCRDHADEIMEVLPAAYCAPPRRAHRVKESIGRIVDLACDNDGRVMIIIETAGRTELSLRSSFLLMLGYADGDEEDEDGNPSPASESEEEEEDDEEFDEEDEEEEEGDEEDE